MARDGSGGYAQPVSDFVNGTTADADNVNTWLDDLGTEMANSVAKDGQSTMTGNLKMGSQKITGLAVGTALTDGPTLGQVQNQAYIYGTTGGTANAQTLTPSPAITSYVAGQMFRCLIGAALTNTGAATLQVSGLASPKSIKTEAGGTLAAGDLIAGRIVELLYDGTDFRILNGDLRGPAFISEVVASASATVDFTVLPTVFDSFEVRMFDVRPATDNQAFRARISEAAVFKSSAGDYGYAGSLWASGGATAFSDGGTATSFALALGNGAGNATGEGLAGWFQISRPASSGASAVRQIMNSRIAAVDGSGSPITTVNGGNRALATPVAIDGLRFLFDSGNITQGTFRLYGWRN